MVDVVDGLKARARILHANVTKKEPAALTRARTLPELKKVPDDGTLAAEVKRRHCLAVIARELGFEGWPHAVSVLTGTRDDDFGTLLCCTSAPLPRSGTSGPRRTRRQRRFARSTAGICSRTRSSFSS